ncbi:hypothetical protein VAE122_3040169 [Vibrio aestuarianus]|nr:hypothetical protein VAE122_3040169 [Vibrio aestuarianus]
MIIGLESSLGYKSIKVCSRPAGMVTVMVTRHNNIRIDCILSDGKNNKLTFIPYYYDGTKGKAFTCKPISDPQSKIIVNKDNVENMKIVYQKYGQ